jgi:hypothetical protein
MNAADGPSGAIQPSDEIQTVERSTRGDYKPVEDDTPEQNTVSVQSDVSEPAIENIGAVSSVAIPSNDAADSPLEAIQPGDEALTGEHCTKSDGNLMRSDTIEQSTTPAQAVETESTILGEADSAANSSTRQAEDGSAGASQPSEEVERAVEHSIGGDDNLTVDESIVLLLIDRQLGLANE